MQPGGPGGYYIDQSVEEMFATISQDESLTAELVDGKIFISKDNGDDTKDYFLIREIADADGNIMYEFFDMGGRIYIPYSAFQRLLLPYHLISQEGEATNDFNEGAEYKTKFGLEEFFDFYNDSGWYNVEKGEDSVIINGYVDEERVFALNDSLKVPLHGMSFGSPVRIQFKSTDTPDNNVIIISVGE